MKHKGFTWLELVIVVSIIGIIAAILIPVFIRAKESKTKPPCFYQIKQIGLGLAQYSQDWDYNYPPVALKNVTSSTEPFKQPFGWADTLYPYLKTTRMFQCWDEGNRYATDATQPNFTDYWMNTNLAQFNINKIQKPAQILLSGEGNDGTEASNARYNMKALPDSWRIDQSKPSFRHWGGANYLFADGHVKLLKPNQIQNKSNKNGAPTFAIK